jgi:uridylate kinase
MSQTFVISVGGSLVVKKEGIQTAWLKKFRQFILREVKKGNNFYLVVGGGVTARQYIKAAKNITRVSEADCDWVGIGANRLNAHLVRAIFGTQAHPEIIIDPTKKVISRKKIIIAAGYQPGWSTDYVAVLLAKTQRINKVINLSNIDYAYNKDPRLFKDAQKLINVAWPEFRHIVGNVWQPGTNTPFDPIASRTAAQYRMAVAILNGVNLSNFSRYLRGQSFIGTTIK